MTDVPPRQLDVTRLLQDWSNGRGEAMDRLLPLVYEELRRMARSQLAREGRNHTLQPTELVHDAFMRLVDQKAGWRNRAHFYGIAATCMRRILVDYARRKLASKRPPAAAAVELNEEMAAGPMPTETVIAIDEALNRLAEREPRQARIAELKCFVGLEVPEIAEMLDVSPATVKRDWAAAKQALHAVLVERKG